MSGKRAAKNTVANSVATRPGRNGGRLLAGGKPGNRGGPGGPPGALRATLGKSFKDRYRIAEEIADSGDAKDQDRLRAVDLLHRWAGLDHVGLPDELLREMAVDVRSEIDDEDTLGRIYERWRTTLASYIARHL